MPNIALTYLYRDAHNYKAHATIRLSGTFTPAELAEITAKLDSGTYFVPAQLGLPPLQHQLHTYSAGPTGADHAFHELLEIRIATAADSDTPIICSTAAFLAKLRAISYWNPRLSAQSTVW